MGCGAGPIPFGMAPPPPPPRTAYLGNPLGASASPGPKPLATPVAAASSRGGAAQQPAYVGLPRQAPAYDPLLMCLWLQQFQQMQQIQKDRDEDVVEDVVGGGRAYRRLQMMKRRIEERPMDLTNEYSQRRLEKRGRREHNGDEKAEKQQVDNPKGNGGGRGGKRNAGGDAVAGS